MVQLERNIDLALELSQDIIRLAGEKNWSDMDALDRQRMQLLEAIFRDPGMKTGQRDLEERIGEILALNDQAMAICKEARQDLTRDGKRLKLGREAIQAYRKQSRD